MQGVETDDLDTSYWKKITWQGAFSKCFIVNNVRQNQTEIKLTDQI